MGFFLLPMSPLADLIEARSEDVLQRWTARSPLRDPVSVVLRELTAALRRGRVPGPPEAGAAPGRPPPVLGSSLEEQVRGYGVLRGLLMDLVEESPSPVPFADVRRLTDFFSDAMAGCVAEHGLAAEQAREAETLLRRITDALPVLVSLVTSEERYGFANRAYEEWFGESQEALLGRTIREVIGEGAYAVLSPHVKRGLAGESFSFEQHRVPYRLGGTRDVKVSFTPYRGTAGEVKGYVALLQDITTQRLLEEERDRAARQRIEILESMGDAFFALDREWRIRLVNRNQEQVSGLRREDTVGRGFWEVFPEAAEPASPYWVEYHRCMEERVVVQFVAPFAPLNIWTDVRAFPTSDGGLAIFFRDVSREKQAEAALRLQAEFEQHLIGIVSHDLRNPLSAILLGVPRMSRREDAGRAQPARR